MELINLMISNRDRRLPCALISDHCRTVMNIDLCDANGRTAFWHAFQNRDYYSMQLLIEEGATNLHVSPRLRKGEVTYLPSRIVRWYELVDGPEYDTFFATRPHYRRLIIRAGVDVAAVKTLKIFEYGCKEIRFETFTFTPLKI